jgi:hypothetical protein
MEIVTNAVILRVFGGNILRVLGGNMGKFKRRQRHSLPFGLFLAVVGALLLPAALVPRANAGSTDYWDSEDPLGLHPRPAPELFSQPQGVLINQRLASNYNANLALNVASGAQPGGFQPLVPDANASWVGGVSTAWSNSANWTAGGPPTGAQIASFDTAFTNQPNIDLSTSVGTLHMATGVTQNVTLSATAGQSLTINGTGIPGTGILIDNTSAFTLTISAPLVVGGAQAWTNNSGNLFTVSGTVALNGNNLTVNGTGNTTISGVISGVTTSTLTKDGSGTLIVTGNNTYGVNLTNGTTVNGGTLLVNGSGDLGVGQVTVNNGGTLGGNSSAQFTTNTGRITVAAGGNFAPGNGGNNTASIDVGPLTLQAGANFRVDLNGTTQGTQYDFVTGIGGGAAGVAIAGSNLVVHVGFSVSVGQTFTIMHNGGGYGGQQFAQGTLVTADNGTTFTITYTGDNIILTVVNLVPEPSTYISGALAIAGLAFTQRRRLRKLIARRCAVGS